MSLIQEALKRQREGDEKNQAGDATQPAALRLRADDSQKKSEAPEPKKSLPGLSRKNATATANDHGIPQEPGASTAPTPQPAPVSAPLTALKPKLSVQPKESPPPQTTPSEFRPPVSIPKSLTEQDEPPNAAETLPPPQPAAPEVTPLTHSGNIDSGPTPTASSEPTTANVAIPESAAIEPPVITTSPESEKEPLTRHWRSLVAVLIALLVLGGGGFFLIVYALRQWHRPADQPPAEATAQQPAKVEPTPALTPPPAPTQTATTIPSAPENVTAPAATATAPATSVAQASTPAQETKTPTVTTQAAAPEKPSTEGFIPLNSPRTETAATPSHENSQAAPAAGIASGPITGREKVYTPPKPPAVWPVLTISAVVGSGRKGSAMINGKILGVGDIIDEVSIVEISRQGVELSYKGEVKTLKVGGSTR